MSNKLERRILKATEVRAEKDGDQKVLTGYAAKFNKLSENLGGFREAIKPGAFKRALAEKQDVKMLVNHDPNLVVGRSGSNLDLSEDKTGLKFRVVLPNTQVANDLHENVRAGIMDQCSFGFIPQSETWTNQRDGGYADVSGNSGNQGIEDKQAIVRELNDVDLKDISAVTYPAYPDTEVKARAALTAVEIRSLFPDGIPEEVAKHMASAIEERAIKYLVTEDDGTTHLPYTDKSGNPDHTLMGAAWAALHGGYRGNKYAGPNKAEAIAKLKGVYKSEGMDTPEESKSLYDMDTEHRHDKIHDIGGLLPEIQAAFKSFDELADKLLDAIDKGNMDKYDSGTENIAPKVKALSALLDAFEKAVDKENTEEEDKERARKLLFLEIATLTNAL